MINLDPPPNGFGSGWTYTRSLYVCFLPLEERIYWLYDPPKGFLCSLSTLEELDTFLRAQSARPIWDSKGYVIQHSAWDLIHPGTAEAEAARAWEARNTPPPVLRSSAAARAGVKLNLGDLGL